MNKLCLFFTLVLLMLTVTGCKKKEFDVSSGKIVVGLECAYAPFNWTETTQTETNVKINDKIGMYAEGYDVMIAKMIAEQLNCELEIEMIEWNGLVPALTSGKIDLIIAGMSPTEDRKEVINFSNEYYKSNHVLLVKSNNKYSSAKTFADLSGAKVIGQKSTLYDTLAKQITEKNANALYQTPLSSVPEIKIALDSGACDVTVLEEPVAQGIIKADPSYTYIKLDTPFDVAAEDVIVSIGLRKVDETLLNKVNEILASISVETRNNLMEKAVSLQQE